MKELLNNIHNFLATHDFPTLLVAVSQLEWSQLAKSGYTWLIILPTLTFLLWTKRIKTIVALVSFFLFLLLVQRTLSGADEALSLHDLLTFLGGAVALIGVNLYLIFVRE